MATVTTTERQASAFVLREDIRARVDALAELLDAAQSMLDYPDIFANQKRLRAALATIQGDALDNSEPRVTPRGEQA